MKENKGPALTKSFDFAVRTVNLYRYLYDKYPEKVLFTQLLKSGTSIGANMREANRAISDNEFLAKAYIALKEADESEYWLELFYATKMLSEQEFTSMHDDCEELLRIIGSITSTTRKRIQSRKRKK